MNEQTTNSQRTVKGQYYRIDWDTCNQLHLYGREAMVYCALIYLCKKAPYTGSATELADFSHCGKKMTTLRMLSSLEKKGLIVRREQCIMLAQTEPSSAQNETPTAQIETISKEKSTKKENITKDNKSESNSTLALYKIILENGYLHPQIHLKNMTKYYDATGWKSDNKAAVLANWMRREQQYGHKPQMSDQAAAFICDMVDALPDYQESFCDALEAVKIEGNKAILYVAERRLQKLGEWLGKQELSPLMDRHRVEISLRPAA